MTVTVFTKPYCPQCDATKRQLTKQGVIFETVNLEQNPETLAQLQQAGFQQAPRRDHPRCILDRLPPGPDSRAGQETGQEDRAGGRMNGRAPATPSTPQPHPRSTPIDLTAAHAIPAADSTTPSTPEQPAGNTVEHIGAVVYFSSASENTARFIESCQLSGIGIAVYRIPLKPGSAPLNVREPYVLMVPTYGGGDAKKAVPPQVKRFLNNPANRAWIRGVVASGNTNFGTAYCAAGDIIAAKCRVPFLYRFELMGTREDTRKVRDGLVRFFRDHRG